MQEKNISTCNLENCQKCSICDTVCPMMAVNPEYPGPKQAGPDGERYRMKSAEFYDKALKYCLNCKRCEVACPSGVHVADMIAAAKLEHGSQTRPLRDTVLASTDLVGGVASTFAPMANFALGLSPVRHLMDGFIGVDERRTFPSYANGTFVKSFDPSSQKGFDRFVTYFHGCYANYNFPQLAWDTVKVVNACGYGVHLMKGEKCCGVAMVANNMPAQAAKNARRNVGCMSRAVAAGEPVLTSSSSCTFMMREEYPNLLGVDNSAVRDSLMLMTKWLYELVEAGKVKLVFKPDFKMKASYHIACHMQKLGWQYYSVGLLRMVPGLDLKVLEQNCCGISGTFGFKKENYELSMRIGSKLFDSIRKSNPQYVITDCETCKWQIEHGTGLEVLNPVSVIAAALDLEATFKANTQ